MTTVTQPELSIHSNTRIKEIENKALSVIAGDVMSIIDNPDLNTLNEMRTAILRSMNAAEPVQYLFMGDNDSIVLRVDILILKLSDTKIQVEVDYTKNNKVVKSISKLIEAN
jgi:CRISPR/Cas system-associated protein Cas5 (RAMP superfamily)